MSSLKHQFNQVLKSKKAFGQKKHIEKKLTGKTDGIHSYATYSQYLDNVMKFSSYLQNKHKEIKSIKQIEPKHAHEYLEYLHAEKNLRPGTLQTYAAAIGKALDMPIDKFNQGIPKKCSVEPQKGRWGNTQHIDSYKHQDLINFVKNTGCRRCEAELITPDQVRIETNGSVYLDFKTLRDWQKQTKGARPKIISRIPTEYQEVLKNMKYTATRNGCETLFENESNNTFNKLGLHKYRREYAQNLYNSLREEYRSTNGYYPKDNYICRGKHIGEAYNCEILKVVSEQLGHSRVDVVINSYFR